MKDCTKYIPKNESWLNISTNSNFIKNHIIVSDI